MTSAHLCVSGISGNVGAQEGLGWTWGPRWAPFPSVLARAPPRFSSFSPRRWHPPAVSTQLRSRSGEPRVWEGGAWETRGRGSVKGGGLWPWAHPVDLSSPLYRPFWSRVKCFSYPGLQRGQFADSTTYQTVVKHHVPDHALMELMV